MKGAAILKAEGATTFRASGVLKKCLRPHPGRAGGDAAAARVWRLLGGTAAESSNFWDLGTFICMPDGLACF